MRQLLILQTLIFLSKPYSLTYQGITIEVNFITDSNMAFFSKTIDVSFQVVNDLKSTYTIFGLELLWIIWMRNVLYSFRHQHQSSLSNIIFTMMDFKLEYIWVQYSFLYQMRIPLVKYFKRQSLAFNPIIPPTP